MWPLLPDIYREQRLRLRGSKLTQVFYLIEGDVRKEERCAELGLPKALCTLQVWCGV